MAHRTASVSVNDQIAFFKVGGTWDMVKENGRLVGSGGLDDATLADVERRYAKQSITAAERYILDDVESSIRESMGRGSEIAEHLSWVPRINKYAKGPFYSLFSGDSSHLRASLIAPLVRFLLQWANQHPDVQVLGAQGTDTADLAILPLLDAFLFDTELLPILFTGANRSQHEWNTDAPKNFFDLFQVAGAHLPAGGYWIFGSHVFRASDMLKIDPTESRRIENYTTFFAPRLTSRYASKVVGENALFQPTKAAPVGRHHPIATLTSEMLFDAMHQVDVVDLGNLNAVHEDAARIVDPRKKAVVVAAFALGNGNNRIKQAVAEAAGRGKLVLIIDKSLLGVVNGRYGASLIWANNQQVGGKHRVLSGYRMNKAIARAILTRALIEGCNQERAQDLVTRYCESRQLFE